MSVNPRLKDLTLRLPPAPGGGPPKYSRVKMDKGYCEMAGIFKREDIAIVDSVGADCGTIPRHTHGEKEVLIVYQGRAELEIGGHIHGLEAGDCFSIPPDTAHTFRYLDNCRVIGITIPASEDYPDA